MAYVVELTQGATDVVASAGRMEIVVSGALRLWADDDLVAVYAPGAWTSASRDGEVERRGQSML